MCVKSSEIAGRKEQTLLRLGSGCWSSEKVQKYSPLRNFDDKKVEECCDILYTIAEIDTLSYGVLINSEPT